MIQFDTFASHVCRGSSCCPFPEAGFPPYIHMIRNSRMKSPHSTIPDMIFKRVLNDPSPNDLDGSEIKNVECMMYTSLY